ncbi:hypothetical protein BV898_06323 [Hypsibius exemplaris]|uniref:PHD-type domain-containing protein n=1 Tax=Hypsibius exemplaris TaxID=2072580 RepID=A0A1W0WWH6_HYPEX|nr:hypothetical protein BV898_06323 [Hypsibius exemplaris]
MPPRKKEIEIPDRCGICRKTIHPETGETFLFGCEECEQWVHVTCDQFDTRFDEDDIEDFFCRQCREDKGIDYVYTKVGSRKRDRFANQHQIPKKKQTVQASTAAAAFPPVLVIPLVTAPAPASADPGGAETIPVSAPPVLPLPLPMPIATLQDAVVMPSTWSSSPSSLRTSQAVSESDHQIPEKKKAVQAPTVTPQRKPVAVVPSDIAPPPISSDHVLSNILTAAAPSGLSMLTVTPTNEIIPPAQRPVTRAPQIPSPSLTPIVSRSVSSSAATKQRTVSMAPPIPLARTQTASAPKAPAEKVSAERVFDSLNSPMATAVIARSISLEEAFGIMSDDSDSDDDMSEPVAAVPIVRADSAGVSRQNRSTVVLTDAAVLDSTAVPTSFSSLVDPVKRTEIAVVVALVKPAAGSATRIVESVADSSEACNVSIIAEKGREVREEPDHSMEVTASAEEACTVDQEPNQDESMEVSSDPIENAFPGMESINADEAVDSILLLFGGKATARSASSLEVDPVKPHMLDSPVVKQEPSENGEGTNGENERAGLRMPIDEDFLSDPYVQQELSSAVATNPRMTREEIIQWMRDERLQNECFLTYTLINPGARASALHEQ